MASTTADSKYADPAWAWKPCQDDKWDLAGAGHLYRRAAFGADWDQLQQALKDGPQRTIDRLLTTGSDLTSFNSRYDAFDRASKGSIESLKAWWLRRMIETPHPLGEKMTLFWHGFFAVSNANVKDGSIMSAYIAMLRSNALGSFATMLRSFARDPALLLGLSAANNRKAMPSLNLARPILENFTVGPGNYTDRDVTELARAYTGWFAARGRVRYIEREHDTEPKTLFGTTGELGIDEAVEILLKQRATAANVVRRLYRAFISESPDPSDALIAPLVDTFAADYDIRKLLGRMLGSNLFFSKAAYRRRVKSPVEFSLSIVHPLEASVSTTQLAADIADLGMDLYYPPTAAGWPSGRRWINEASAASRSNLAHAMLVGKDPYGKKLDPRSIAAENGATDAQAAAEFMLKLMLQDDISPASKHTVMQAAGKSADASDAAVRQITQTIVALPEFALA